MEKLSCVKKRKSLTVLNIDGILESQNKKEGMMIMKNIKHIRETYIRTSSGKSWSTAKDNIDIVEKMVDLDFFKNFTSEENIRFFNNRVFRTYEKVGFVPTKLTGISPDGQQRTVDTFIFTD